MTSKIIPLCEHCSSVLTPSKGRKKKRFCNQICVNAHNKPRLKARNKLRSEQNFHTWATLEKGLCSICSSDLPIPRPINQKVCSDANCKKRHKSIIDARGIARNPARNARALFANRLRELVVKKGLQKINAALPYIGCSGPELIAWIESQFEKGMSWQSWGVFGWHIDHVIPASWFDFTNKDHLYVALNWRNIRPLWAEVNVLKSDSLPKCIIPELLEMAEKIGVVRNGVRRIE